MARHDTKNYDTLTNQEANPFNNDTNKLSPTTDEEETPQSSPVVIHVVPEASKARWNHIPDLDSFFIRTYCYHQKHGFKVMMVQKILELAQFAFAVILIVYMTNCVDYSILFNDKDERHKISLGDAMLSPNQCAATLSGWAWLILVMAGLFFLFRLIKTACQVFDFWDIKQFYNTTLKIDDADLDNLTWHEVQKRIREVQSEIQMSINKEQLTELDIYHRILRFKNYMVAMMNKSLLPSTIQLPFLGNVVCLSQALRYNIGLILFWGPWSPFENNWHLREEYKRSNKRIELAARLSQQIFWVAIANIVLSPFIFLCQLMYFFFNYADLIKKEPGTLAVRCWSQYGKLYLRHFNELDHELDARLTRAYRPAVKYMNSFSSPMLTVIARNVYFVCGGIASLIFLLAVYDEDVFQVQHVFTIFTVMTAISVIARSVIPDENMIWCPEQLLRNVLAHVHYLPSSWRGYAHTSFVRDQFEQFFQLKAMYILNELFSPFVAPFVLLFELRPKALDLVDFFRNFTVDVVGVGDVCSFAQMDVRKHGNPDWQITNSAIEKDTSEEPVSAGTTAPIVENNQYTQGEHGKTELSLVHFTLTNPTWQMPPEARHFVQGIKRHALQDLNRQRGMLYGTTAGTTTTNAMAQSLLSMESLGEQYQSIIYPILQTNNLSNSQQLGLSMNLGGFASPPMSMMAPQPVAAGGAVGSHGGVAQHSHYQFNNPPAFDFERMLQQNLTDGSTAAPLRSTFLHDIDEHDDDEGGPPLMMAQTSGPSQTQSSGGPAPRGSSSALNARTTMSFSTRGGMTRREGPAEGSRNGLLSSLCGDIPATHPTPHEITTADMCLSTLYLHELHHNHVRRRGGSFLRTEPVHARQQWQRPHQQQSPSMFLPSVSGTTSAASVTAAERTPLLGGKKS